MKFFKYAIIRYVLAFTVLISGLGVYHMVEVSGEQSDPRVMLLRLEDIGPGGQYDSIDQLGKLRAVFEYFEQQGVRYQIGVIPRWINILPDKSVYNRTLNEKDDPYIQAFVRLLHQAEAGGAVIGMHGYTHQVGMERRADDHQESAIGNEFNVSDVPETATNAFADERLQAGLEILDEAGIVPRFWESPHYHTVPEQQKVFRSYFGLIYENVLEDPKQPHVQYVRDANNGYGTSSIGSVYVPTPFSFIPYNRDERLILDQMGKSDRASSFFYHPFLEFKYLIPVLDEDGEQVIRDGLPEYQYPDKAKSNMQKLVPAVKERGYSFYSIQDYVPFTPSQQVPLPGGKASQVKWGDVTGDKQLDAVAWDDKTGAVTVKPCDLNKRRNAEQPAEEKWAVIQRGKGDQFVLVDSNRDGYADFWVLRASGWLEEYRSNGQGFVPNQTVSVELPLAWDNAEPIRLPNGGWGIVGASADGTNLLGLVNDRGVWKPVEPFKSKNASFKNMQISMDGAGGESVLFLKKRGGTGLKASIQLGDKLKWKLAKLDLNLPENDGIVRVGDFNGDGLEDALLWNDATNEGTVYLRLPEGTYRKLSSFGPWGKENGKMIVEDFDGNGKADIGMMNADNRTIDTALSFESK